MEGTNKALSLIIYWLIDWLTFLPSNSWGPLVNTLSTEDGSANVTKPNPLWIKIRKTLGTLK